MSAARDLSLDEHAHEVAALPGRLAALLEGTGELRDAIEFLVRALIDGDMPELAVCARKMAELAERRAPGRVRLAVPAAAQRPTTITATCAWCDRPFATRSKLARTCSARCRKATSRAAHNVGGAI